MTAITMIIVALVALAAGFVGGKMYTEKTLQQAELKQQIEDSQQQMEQYKSEVSSHLVVTQHLMDEMKTNYDNITTQLAKTTRLLETPREADKDNISYFANDTTAQLLSASINNEFEKRESTQLDSQPSDYSDSASGLFSQGKDNQKAQAKKAQPEEA